MVKYGRHLEFLRQRFPKSVYLVDYKGIQHSTDRAAFSADWQEGLARATAAKEEGVAGLWSRVFQGVSSDPELRGVRPLVALHTYHGAVGAAETQQLLESNLRLQSELSQVTALRDRPVPPAVRPIRVRARGRRTRRAGAAPPPRPPSHLTAAPVAGEIGLGNALH